MAVGSINTIVRDIFNHNTKALGEADLVGASDAIAQAKQKIYPLYNAFLKDESVVAKMQKSQQDLQDLENNMIKAYNDAKSTHRQNLYAFKTTINITSKQEKVHENWRVYRDARDKYHNALLTSKKRIALEYDGGNWVLELQEAMISSMLAIEQARNCFQKEVKYSIAFIDDESGSKIIKEGLYTLSELIGMNALQLNIQKGASWESSFGINLFFNKSILDSPGLIEIQNSGLETKIQNGPNRGWRYEFFKKTNTPMENFMGPLEKQNNVVWSAAPDLITPEGVPLQAKFIGFSRSSASLHVSSLNSILVSLETYATLLNVCRAKALNTPDLDSETLFNNFVEKITKNLTENLAGELT